ncbi:MAG: hypothetical protein ACE5E4_07685 [Candidatus Binatia bacterium]
MARSRSIRKLDPQELKIAKALIRNPRISDNRLGEENSIPVRTVNRKRTRMESERLLRYFAEVDMSETGTGHFSCRHLYIIRFKVGVRINQFIDELHREPKVVTVFTRSVYESHVAEIDGRVALVMVIEGVSDADIVERFQEEIVPALRKNHGKDTIEEISTIRLLSRVRMLRNYIPEVNMDKGRIRDSWHRDSVFVA